MATKSTYGVTPTLSDSLPTEEEKRKTDTLVEELRRQKTFESPSETDKRCVQLAVKAVGVAELSRAVGTKYLNPFSEFATSSLRR